jgi:uncharacterized protein (UPF0333 family)
MTRLSFTLAALAFAAVVVSGYLLKRDAAVATRTVAKMETVTNNAAKKGKRAAERSTTAGVRGTRDPTTRDD